jgi:hypothetical protein
MKRHRLAAWSGQRVLALWLVWFGLLLGVEALRVQREYHRAPATTNPADSGPGPERRRLKYLPEQHTDFVYSVVITPESSLRPALLLLGPPGLITLLWLYARRRHPGEGSRL